MATDNVLKKWGDPGTLYQKETRKYWDRTYVYGIKDNGTIGGMSTATDDFYAYCNELTLGGVSKGTWNAKRKDGYIQHVLLLELHRRQRHQYLATQLSRRQLELQRSVQDHDKQQYPLRTRPIKKRLYRISSV